MCGDYGFLASFAVARNRLSCLDVVPTSKMALWMLLRAGGRHHNCADSTGKIKERVMHNLESYNGLVSFVSRREVPWHRLGTVTEEWLGLESAMEMSRTDYIVESMPVFAFDGRKAVKCEGTKANVRQQDGHQVVLGVVSDTYRILQNSDAFEALEVLQRMGASVETMGVLGNGEKAFASVKFPGAVLVDGHDEVDMYALILNGHDGRTSYTGLITPVRAVCQNTVALATQAAKRSLSFRHTSSVINAPAAARALFTSVAEYRDGFEDIANRLADIEMDTTQFEGFVRDWMPKPPTNATKAQLASMAETRQKIVRLWSSDTQANIQGTRWAAYNVIVEWLDWCRPIRTRTTDAALDSRATAVVTGDKLSAKDRAAALLLSR